MDDSDWAPIAYTPLGKDQGKKQTILKDSFPNDAENLFSIPTHITTWEIFSR